MNSKFFLYAFVILISFTCNVFGAKILALFPFGGKSHFVVIKALMTELSKRGHEVTMITHFHIDEKLNNFTEILIEPTYPYWDDVNEYFDTKSVLDLSDMSVEQAFDMVHLIGLKTTEHALQNAKVQEFIHNTNHEFDLVITEQFFQEAFLMIPYKMKVPVIALTTCTIDNFMTSYLGMINPYAHVPLLYLPYTDKMSFTERLKNTYWSLLVEYKRHYQYFPAQDELVRKYFSHYGEPLPPVAELEKNISLLLANSYVPLDIPRPSTMALVQVGGIHINHAKDLPRRIKGFIDSSPQGVVYMNLGTQVQSSDMSPELVQSVLKAFGSLKQNVLWKWEDEKLANKPKNVFVSKWFPQNDILAHPYVRAFITHGGLLGLQEAVYRNVPVIGIPIYCDQHRNIEIAVRDGYGIRLDFKNISETSLKWAIETIIHNPSYIENMRKASQIFRDRPLSALETAIYWVDYVIKYKGAPHIKSHATHLPWYSLYLLDIIGLFAGVVLGIFSFVYAAFRIRGHLKTRRREKFHKL